MLTAITAVASSAAHAADLYWVGGDGDWDGASQNWTSGSVGGALATFTNGDNTFFHTSGGNINLTGDFSTPFQQIGDSGLSGLNYNFTSNVVGGVTLSYTSNTPLEFLGTNQQLTIGSGVNARFTGGNWGDQHIRGNGNTLNIDGGTLARTNGVAWYVNNTTVNVTNGGVWGGDFSNGNQIFLGTGSQATLNVDAGGVVHIGVADGTDGNNRHLLIGQGNGGGGEVTLSGGEINIYNGNQSALLFGDNQTVATTATFNLDGGVLHTRQIREQDSAGGQVTSTFNFNGGVLEVSANNTATASFMQGLTSAVVKAGGAIVDTNGQSVTINQVLEHDAALGATADGGLTKQGVGTLTLGGANTYTGDTVVLGGTDASNPSVLSITSAFLSDTGNVVIGEFGELNLNFVGIDTIAGLVLDGVAMEVGTYGSVGSGADFENDTFFSGNGLLEVTAVVPEASSLALMLGGAGMLLTCARRKVRG